MMMAQPGERGDDLPGASAHQEVARPVEQMSLEELRSDVRALREREQQIVELLAARSPDRILHDLRNLLNEVQLLRALAEQDET